jgi:hypothetical protein
VAVIPEQYLARLRAAGLIISEPFIHNHFAFPDGVLVSKPASVAGHSIPGFLEASGGQVDAPGLYLHREGGTWVVTSCDYVPGPGPGDFINQWDTPEVAVADILDFYFGNPARMDVKSQARESLW